jgi:hypothetical protein
MLPTGIDCDQLDDPPPYTNVSEFRVDEARYEPGGTVFRIDHQNCIRSPPAGVFCPLTIHCAAGLERYPYVRIEMAVAKRFLRYSHQGRFITSDMAPDLLLPMGLSVDISAEKRHKCIH